MSVFGIAILSGHFLLLTILCMFGLHRLSMVFRWCKYRKIKPEVNQRFNDLPNITVQIPLYNEKFVAQRIIDACAQFTYPADKLQIQIVDDSTDDTKDLVASRVDFHRANGVNISHVHRTNRQGFKAGALKEAMDDASGEFIAIFDADFIPEPDTFNHVIHYFTNEKMGMLQFRWEHLNRHSNGFTEAQSMMLDAHFALEQQVRCSSNKLFNFNGTAGIWRKAAIIDAGNWSADTLTEDLDLSYRAQLKGWDMLYLNDVSCPGEIPANMTAFRSQQHRWAKGGIQVMLKMLGTVWRAPISLTKKLESTFHLSNNLAYFIMLFDTIVFLIPSLIVREIYQIEYIFWFDLPLMVLATGGHSIYLFFGQVALGHKKRRAFLHIPTLMLLGIQLAFNNARAGLEALRGLESEFVRTPKSGDKSDVDKIVAKPKQQYSVALPQSAVVEFILALVYIAVFVWAVMNQIWFMLPFLLLLVAGFMTTAMMNLRRQFSASA